MCKYMHVCHCNTYVVLEEACARILLIDTLGLSEMFIVSKKSVFKESYDSEFHKRKTELNPRNPRVYNIIVCNPKGVNSKIPKTRILRIIKFKLVSCFLFFLLGAKNLNLKPLNSKVMKEHTASSNRYNRLIQ